MEQLCAVAEGNEGRRYNGGLSHIIYLQSSALIGRRLNPCNRICKHVVKHTRRNTQERLLVNVIDMLKELRKSLTGFSRDKEDSVNSYMA